MNYGAMGFAIGHEITHGFDDIGRQFDKDGVLSDWWEKETQNQFMKKARCIIDQYSNYTVSSVDLNVILKIYIKFADLQYLFSVGWCEHAR